MSDDEQDEQFLEDFRGGVIIPVDDIDGEAIRKRLIQLNLEVIEFLVQRLKAGRYRTVEVDRLRIEYSKGIGSLSNSLNRLLKSEDTDDLLKRLKEVERLAAKTTAKNLRSKKKDE